MADVYVGLEELPIRQRLKDEVQSLLDVFAGHALIEDIMVYTRVWPQVTDKHWTHCVVRVSVDCDGEEELITEGTAYETAHAIDRAMRSLAEELRERIRHLHWVERRDAALA